MNNQPALTLNCPNCGRSVEPQDRECSNCGIDLALAAALASAALSATTSSAASKPVAPEVLVPKLGELLVEKGLLSRERLNRALEVHGSLTGVEKGKLFGQVLLELGYISRETLDMVVTEQIIHLQQALQESNRELERRVSERTSELQNALEKLAELNRLKNSFISNITHELRTPMTHLKGYITLLQDEALGPLEAAQKEAMQVMGRSQARLEQLIEDLIEFSLIERGQLTLDKKPVSVADLLRKVIARGEPLAVARQVQIELQLPEKRPFIAADLGKISWVLMQLTDNAIKFTPQGGQVLLSVRTLGERATLSVKDTGIGIPAARIQEIFEPFHQLDGSDSRAYGGTGLGLAMVQKIIQAHGSSVQVISQPGKGSEFSFSLPICDPNYV